MNKYVYLVRPKEQVDIAAFKSQILQELVPRLLQRGPDKLKIDLTEPRRPRLAVLPLKSGNLAMVSVWDRPAARSQQWAADVTKPSWDVAGYEVTESSPKTYTKNWKDGEPSPGVVMLTLMRKNRHLSREQFLHEWFEYHTPVFGLGVHPLWNYIRNVVESVIVDGSPTLDGIVEEHFRRRQDVTNPARYFGGPLMMIPNIIRVGVHANKFLEISATENYLLTEYHIRS